MTNAGAQTLTPTQTTGSSATMAPVSIENRPARFSTTSRRLGDMQTVTFDQCTHCRGPINNHSIARSNRNDRDTWVHMHDEDWADDVHQAVPAAGPVTDADQPLAPTEALDFDMATRWAFRRGDWPVMVNGHRFDIRAASINAVPRRGAARRRKAGLHGFELERVEDRARFYWLGESTALPTDAKLMSDEPAGTRR